MLRFFSSRLGLHFGRLWDFGIISFRSYCVERVQCRVSVALRGLHLRGETVEASSASDQGLPARKLVGVVSSGDGAWSAGLKCKAAG